MKYSGLWKYLDTLYRVEVHSLGRGLYGFMDIRCTVICIKGSREAMPNILYPVLPVYSGKVMIVESHQFGSGIRKWTLKGTIRDSSKIFQFGGNANTSNVLYTG